jgi:hypothetical protein
MPCLLREAPRLRRGASQHERIKENALSLRWLATRGLEGTHDILPARQHAARRSARIAARSPAKLTRRRPTCWCRHGDDHGRARPHPRRFRAEATDRAAGCHLYCSAGSARPVRSDRDGAAPRRRADRRERRDRDHAIADRFRDDRVDGLASPRRRRPGPILVPLAPDRHCGCRLIG